MKMRTHNPKSVGHREHCPKREIHSITSLSQKQEKVQVNNLKLHLKELEKEHQTKLKDSRVRK